MIHSSAFRLLGGEKMDSPDEPADYCLSVLESGEHMSLLLSLMIFEGIGIVFGIGFLAASIVYIAVVDRVRTRMQFIQLQLCSSLLLSELVLIVGFLISPCQPLEIADSDVFVGLCVFVAALQVFFTMASFCWTLSLSVYICHLVAKRCQAKLSKQLEASKKDPTAQNFSKERAHRKISRDLMEMSKHKSNSNYQQELEQLEQEEREKFSTAWYVQLFSALDIPNWLCLLGGYLPAFILALLSTATLPNVDIPGGSGQPKKHWIEIKGLDMFCYPGVQSRMMWYMVVFIPFLLLATLYLRVKAIRMTRVLRGRPLLMYKAMSHWQRQRRHSSVNDFEQDKDKATDKATDDKDDWKAGLGLEEFHVNSSGIQTLVVTFHLAISLLSALYIWGMMIPFAMLSFIKGFVFFLYNVLEKTRLCAKK